MKNNKFFGFTLAEIMIVLTVIGVLAGILIPIASSSRPDQNIMKFKKSYSTLGNVVRELVTSDRYYNDGMLNKLKSGTIANNTFCLTFTDVISTKYVNCSTTDTTITGSGDITKTTAKTVKDKTDDNKEYSVTEFKKLMDDYCLSAQAKYTYPEIVTTDGVVWYSTNPATKFSETLSGGFYRYYKIMCIDVDVKLDKDNKVTSWGTQEPFAVGIRVDGKIMGGAWADIWQQKDFQKATKK